LVPKKDNGKKEEQKQYFAVFTHWVVSWLCSYNEYKGKKVTAFF